MNDFNLRRILLFSLSISVSRREERNVVTMGKSIHVCAVSTMSFHHYILSISWCNEHTKHGRGKWFWEFSSINLAIFHFHPFPNVFFHSLVRILLLN